MHDFTYLVHIARSPCLCQLLLHAASRHALASKQRLCDVPLPWFFDVPLPWKMIAFLWAYTWLANGVEIIQSFLLWWRWLDDRPILLSAHPKGIAKHKLLQSTLLQIKNYNVGIVTSTYYSRNHLNFWDCVLPEILSFICLLETNYVLYQRYLEQLEGSKQCCIGRWWVTDKATQHNRVAKSHTAQ